MKIEYSDDSYIELTYDSVTDKIKLTMASKDYAENVLLISTVELTPAEYKLLVKDPSMLFLLQ